MHALLTAILLALALPALAPQTHEALEIQSSFEVDIPPQPAQIAAASDQALYLVDLAASRVVSYSPSGNKLWDRDFLALGARRSLLAITVDRQNRPYVLDARQKVIYRLDGQGQVSHTIPLPEATDLSFLPFRSLSVNDDGSELRVLSGRHKRRVHVLDEAGALRRTIDLDADLEAPGETLDPGGLVAVDGGILWRPAGRLPLYHLAGTVPVQAVAAFVPTFSSQHPEPALRDSVFAIDRLLDGRFIYQVVHRTPFVRETGTRGLTYQLRVYVFGADGTLLHTIKPDTLGVFVAASPGGSLYFATTSTGPKQPAGPRVTVASLIR
jgi:hypothetical protein